LFSRGLFEDVERIWDAKQSGFELSCYLDVQFLCGAGLDETKRFLAKQPFRAAGEALADINKCEQAGNFVDFSPERHLQTYREYFRV
jgi:hypothetical protein